MGGRGGASAPQVKRRFQVLVAGTVVFMVCVSLLILQPELFSGPPAREPSIFTAFQKAPAPGEDQTGAAPDLPPPLAELKKGGVGVGGVPLARVVDRLVERFRVDLSERLAPGQSPWSVAAAWVTARHVLPEPAPELGQCLAVLRVPDSVPPSPLPAPPSLHPPSLHPPPCIPPPCIPILAFH